MARNRFKINDWMIIWPKKERELSITKHISKYPAVVRFGVPDIMGPIYKVSGILIYMRCDCSFIQW